MRPELTDDEWDTLLDVLHDHGLIDSYYIADYNKVEELRSKLAEYYLEGNM